MDPKEIRELIELISRSNFAEFELEGKGFKLKLVKQAASDGGAAPAVQQVVPASAPTAPRPLAAPTPEATAEGAQSVAADDGTVDVRSPIVGTFYRSASPESEPFVEVGDQVKRGQVLCIVEAMKVMNEIESEVDGEVLEIPVSNGQPVEYGEVLFRLRPSS